MNKKVKNKKKKKEKKKKNFLNPTVGRFARELNRTGMQVHSAQSAAIVTIIRWSVGSAAKNNFFLLISKYF